MSAVSPSANSPHAATVPSLAPPPSTSPQPLPTATVPTPSSPPPSSPPSSPQPAATVPTPSSPPPPSSSPPPPPPPSSPQPAATVPTPSSPSPPPDTVLKPTSPPSPPLATSPPPPSAPPQTSSPPPQVTPPPLFSSPPSPPPPITSSPPRSPRNPPPPPPPRNPSSPPPPSRSPTPPSPGPTKNPSPPTPRAPPPPRTPPAPGPTKNPSPLAPRAPPPTRLSPPPHSDVSIPPPGNLDNDDSSLNIPSGNGGNQGIGIGIGGIVGIGVVIGAILLMLIVLVSCCLIKRKKKIVEHNGLYDMSPRSDSGLLKIRPIAVGFGSQSANEFVYSLQFTYEDLVEATNGFSPLNLLGSGGFGFVYKGYLAGGTEVAVKELKIGGGQGEREFSAEVEIISRIHHRHLVSLVGYCVSENKRLLVYEYVPNNTLQFHLHVSDLVLDWPTRVKVASGAARGIAYLHEDCHPRIIHRDIKSSNILLDKNFDARVSDFGLAKLAADMCTHVTTRVMGTFGYMAPEYASSGVLTEKSDVFSYGVVLLELITGRKSVDVSQPLGDEGLVEWARPLLSHALETEDFRVLVDQRLGTNFVASEMFRMIEAAAACIRHSATRRPRMGQIVRAFESPETEDLSNGMKVGQSEIYSSGQQSAEISLFRNMEFGSQNYSTDYFTQGSTTPYSNERYRY